ncbi:hypothetical protein [Sorangium sp. So ce513]|uniref:HORMA-1 domain-containing protein n=1 Tax=Sorangium sp. So ce513 TaxID=3133315 RepID=UPI003F617601
MTTSTTIAQTSTFSEARARTVMRQVLGDFMIAASANLIARDTIQRWHEDLEYAVLHEVVDTFQLQFTKPDGARLAINYAVRDDGSVMEASKAGGLDLHGLPVGTRVNVLLTYRTGARNIEAVRAHLRRRGWTAGGSLVAGVASRDRAFSKSGFGIERSKVGDWE